MIDVFEKKRGDNCLVSLRATFFLEYGERRSELSLE